MIIRAGEISQRQSVRLSPLAKKVDSRNATATGHILHDDGWATRHMTGQMARDDAPFNVSRTAGAEVDKESNRLALVIGRLRALGCRRN